MRLRTRRDGLRVQHVEVVLSFVRTYEELAQDMRNLLPGDSIQYTLRVDNRTTPVVVGAAVSRIAALLLGRS